MSEIQAERGVSSLIEVIDEMSFGQIIKLISVMDIKKCNIIFNHLPHSRTTIIDIFDRIVDLRNHIAHLKNLMSTKQIRQRKQNTFSVKQALNDLNSVANSDIKNKMKLDIQHYKLKKIEEMNNGEINVSIETMNKIFDVIDKFLF